jgi:UMF1 family MFS transporter
VADSAFTTVIVSTFYSVYFGNVVVGNRQQADVLWGMAGTLSELSVALLAPLLGAMADFSASRKRFLLLCALVVSTFTASLGLVGPGMVTAGVVLFVLANIGFAGGGIFIDSFLPGLATESNAGRLSGVKWACGYASGLVSLLICVLIGAEIPPDPTADQVARARLVPVVIAAYYALAVIPTFLYLRDRTVAQVRPPRVSLARIGFQRMAETWRHVRRYRELFKLLIAFLVYNDGIVTVIYFAGRYATETLHFSLQEMIILFIVMNVIAALAALAFGSLADRIGQKRTIVITLIVWNLSVALAFVAESKVVFWVAASLAGIGMGSSQSVTRSLFALFTPPEKAAEFSGLLGIAGKALAITGPLVFGAISALSGSQRPAILSIAVYFIVGIILVARVDERRGIEARSQP